MEPKQTATKSKPQPPKITTKIKYHPRPPPRPAPVDMRPPRGARGTTSRRDVVDVEENTPPKSEKTSPPRSVCLVSAVVKDHPDLATINVITKLLSVFAPTKGFFDAISQHGTPVKVLKSMIKDYGVSFPTIQEMYTVAQEAPDANVPSSSTGEQRRKISEPVRRVKRTRRYEGEAGSGRLDGQSSWPETEARTTGESSCRLFPRKEFCLTPQLSKAQSKLDAWRDEIRH